MDKRTKILLGLLLVLILLGGGYAAYLFYFAEQPEMTEVAAVDKTVAVEQGAPAPEKAPAADAQAAAPGTPAEPAGPAITVTEMGKKTDYKSPEEFLEKTKLSEAEIRNFSQSKLSAARKSYNDLQKKGDKDKVAAAGKLLEMYAKLDKLVAEKFPEKPEKKAVIYTSLGKRDPFMSPLEVPKIYPVVPPNAKPLEKVAAESITVKAIMWSENGYRALVVTPDGRGYTVKVGDTLGNKKGKVVEISKKRVYVVEKIPDILGDVETRNIVIKLYKEAG